MNKFIQLFFALFVISGTAMAQEATGAAQKPGFWADPFADPNFTLYVIMALVVILAILVIVVGVYILKILTIMTQKAAEEKAARLGIPYVPEPTWWQRIDRQLTDAVPLDKENTILLDHNYDGIRELDNHLPPWWKWLLYLTIVWSAIYFFVYHVSHSLPLSEEEYQISTAQSKSNKPVAAFDESTLAPSTDAAVLENGKVIFNSNCASCHRADGGGDIGPNLTDEYWLHGNSIKDIFKVVTDGVPNTNMIPWKASLGPEKIRDVSNYILSIQGSNPSNPKAPQGTKAGQPAPATDSVKVQASL